MSEFSEFLKNKSFSGTTQSILTKLFVYDDTYNVKIKVFLG